MIFLVSMVPIVELRGAIPISQGFQLPLLQSYIICVIGNMLPVPIIYLFARRVLEWGKDKKYIGKFFTFCIEKGHKGGAKLKEKAGSGLFVLKLCLICRTSSRSSIASMNSSKSIGYIVWISTLPTGNENSARLTATSNRLPAATWYSGALSQKYFKLVKARSHNCIHQK